MTRTNLDGSSLQDFNDEEDFKLSTDQHASIAHLGAANALSQKSLVLQKYGPDGEKFMDDRLRMQQLGHGSTKSSMILGEGLKQNLNDDGQKEHKTIEQETINQEYKQ